MTLPLDHWRPRPRAVGAALRRWRLGGAAVLALGWAAIAFPAEAEVLSVQHPADIALGKFIADETEKWGKVIRAANIKPE